MNEFDAITLEILWNRLIHIAEECWITIWRTAFSTIIGEAQDFGCELLDADGNSLAHAPRSMPVFNLSLPIAVRALLAEFPKDELRDGDVLVTNDPWMCAGHLFDIAVVTPVFIEGRIVALVGSIAHCSDIGGNRAPLGVREVYEEGLQIPPLKLMRAGQINEDLLALIRQNVRKPEMVLGDMQAQVSANAVGRERLLELMQEYNLTDLGTLARTIQDRAEEAMRAAIAAVPDGTYTYDVETDGLGDGCFRLPAKVTVQGSDIHVDYDGAPPQVTGGGINCTYNYTASHTVYALKCILTPDIPSNAGCDRPIHVAAPQGSILNCLYPAPVNVRTKTGWYLAPLMFGALAPVLESSVKSYTAQPLSIGAYGQDADGSVFNDHMLQGGGAGASLAMDGQNTLLYPTSAANVAVEMFEVRTPLTVECKELIPGSGGDGKWRGGLGQRLIIKKRHRDGVAALCSVLPEGVHARTQGLFGGEAGSPARVAVLHADGTESPLPPTGTVLLENADDRLLCELGGGSGYGDPQLRDPQARARDKRLGYA